MSFNLQMRRGDTYAFNLTVTQAGSAFNLTGASVRMTAKWAYTDPDSDAVFVRTVGSGIGFLSASGGLATVTIAPANTSSLPGNSVNLVYDIQVTDVSDNIYTIVDGILTVLPDVSITTP